MNGKKNASADCPLPADRTLWPVIMLLVAVVGLFESTPLDLVLQDRCFDFATGHWWVNAADPFWRALCYTGPKAALLGLGLILLGLTAGPDRWRTQLRVRRREAAVALLTLASVPALIGLGKSTTNVFCPSELRRYGGDAPYVKLAESYPRNDRPARRGRGFPAGHASGGFALVGLAWLRPTRAWRRGALLLALGAGWWMGGYQMLRGAHFLSHTVTTMLAAWIVALAWRRILVPANATVTTARAERRLDGGNARSRV